jgi:ribonuclease HI
MAIPATNAGQTRRLRVIVPPMSWARMRFKGGLVWVRADESGTLMLDADGRAEMKYRESDAKSYRPSPGNLTPDSGDGPAAPASPGSGATATATATVRKSTRAPGEGKAGLPGGAVEIWTDGACSGNPGPMGIGVVVIDGATRREAGEYLGEGTNNIAELTAIDRGIELAGADRGDGRRFRIYTDSSYSIGVLSKGWKAKANQELVARIKRRLAAIPRVEFVKVAGHAGVPENERCDELATGAVLGRARR